MTLAPETQRALLALLEEYAACVAVWSAVAQAQEEALLAGRLEALQQALRQGQEALGHMAALEGQRQRLLGECGRQMGLPQAAADLAAVAPALEGEVAARVAGLRGQVHREAAALLARQHRSAALARELQRVVGAGLAYLGGGHPYPGGGGQPGGASGPRVSAGALNVTA